MSLGADIGIIIVAAGSGNRFGGELPKQYCMLGDSPVVVHAIRRFQNILPQAHIILVLAADRMQYWHGLKAQYAIEKVEETVGGATRWESVSNALARLPHSLRKIMVHDGARPLVQQEVIYRLLETCETADGALPVLPMTDSIRLTSTDGGSRAVDRSLYRAVQTPQLFDAAKLRKAYALPFSPVMTDDASVMEAAGFDNIILCEGSEATLKITHRLDLQIASLYLSNDQ